MCTKIIPIGRLLLKDVPSLEAAPTRESRSGFSSAGVWCADSESNREPTDYMLATQSASYWGAEPGTGRSELKASRTTFHDPSASLRHTVTYLPRSASGLPDGPLKVIAYVPLE